MGDNCRIRPGRVSPGKPRSDCARRNGKVFTVAASVSIASTQTSETAGKIFHSTAAILKLCRVMCIRASQISALFGKRISICAETHFQKCADGGEIGMVDRQNFIFVVFGDA